MCSNSHIQTNMHGHNTSTRSSRRGSTAGAEVEVMHSTDSLNNSRHAHASKSPNSISLQLMTELTSPATWYDSHKCPDQHTSIYVYL